MKKYIASLSLLFTVAATAQEIYMPIPFAATGTVGPAVPIVAEELKSRGWKIDYKLIGSCGPVKESYTNSKKPVVTVWASNWQKDSSNTCYMNVDDKNFAGIFFYNTYFLCGPKSDLNFNFQSGKTYTVAINQFNTKTDISMLNNLASSLKVDFKLVNYKNSGAVTTAFKSKETDLVYINSGVAIGLMKNNETKCLYTNTKSAYENVLPITNVLKNNVTGETWVGFFLTSQGDLTDKQYSKLKNDVRDIVKNSTELNRYIDSRNLFKYESKLGNEIDFIKSGIKE